MYDLLQLRLFKAVALRGSFSQVASELRISPSTVSRNVAQLEERLGAKLFNRTTHDCQITGSGKIFLEYITQALVLLEEGERSLHEEQGQVTGPLKVLMPNSFCKNYIMAELAAFLERHPRLELDLHIFDYGSELMSQEFDVGVQHGPPNYGGHVTRTIGVMRLILVASPAYLEKYGAPTHPSDLGAHRCIGFSAPNDMPFKWRFSFRGEKLDIAAPVSHLPDRACYVSGQHDASVQGALHSVGVTPIDIAAAIPHLRAGDLKIVLPGYELAQDTSLHLYYPAATKRTKKVREFIDFVVDVAKRRLDPDDFDPFHYAA